MYRMLCYITGSQMCPAMQFLNPKFLALVLSYSILYWRKAVRKHLFRRDYSVFEFFLVEKTLKMLVSFFVLAQLLTLMSARKCGESIQCRCSRDTSWIVCANFDSTPIFTLPVKELRRLQMTSNDPENFDYGQVLINRQLLLPPEVPP